MTEKLHSINFNNMPKHDLKKGNTNRYTNVKEGILTGWLRMRTDEE